MQTNYRDKMSKSFSSVLTHKKIIIKGVNVCTRSMTDDKIKKVKALPYQFSGFLQDTKSGSVSDYSISDERCSSNDEPNNLQEPINCLK